MTNYEKIMNMTEEELGMLLNLIAFDYDSPTFNVTCKVCQEYEKIGDVDSTECYNCEKRAVLSKENAIDWLKRESETNFKLKQQGDNINGYYGY